MQVKILKNATYADCGVHHDVCKGDLCELPEFVAGVWLKDGRCELPRAKKEKSPVVEDKSVNPVIENKSSKKATKKKAK